MTGLSGKGKYDTRVSLIITGASGLLGTELSNLAPDAVKIKSTDIDLTSSMSHSDLAEVIKEDKAKSRTSESIIIHCAARVGGVKRNTEKIAEFYKDNIQINMSVMEAARKTKSKLVSVMSTCIYPDAPYVSYPITEDQLHMGPPHYSNFGYAYAKRMLDVQSRAYRQQWGCNFVTVIPNNLYGNNDNYDLQNGHVIPSLIRKFSEAKMKNSPKVTLWGSGRPMREFTFARDAGRIILWIAKNYNEESPVNIGCTEEITIRDLAEKIQKHTKYTGSIVWDLDAPEGQLRKPTSNERLRSLGCKENYTVLDEGLKESIRYFEDNYPFVRGVK